MQQISGILNVYFPFELKDKWDIRQIRRAYDKKRNVQIKSTRYQHHPRTDMMDKEYLRREMEDVISAGQKLMGNVSCYAPYATPNIAKAYHKEREDNFFVKEPSLMLSGFTVVCPRVNRKDQPMDGRLFYFNNLNDYVGTYILSLRFHNLAVDEVLWLKHSFYKRAQVYIEEFPLCGVPMYEKIQGRMTFQEYICKKAKPQAYRRKTDIDCRARYSFMEIGGKGLKEAYIFALVSSNEKFQDIKKEAVKKKDYSRSKSYSLYYDLRSALIVNHKGFDQTLRRQRDFFDNLCFANGYIRQEVMSSDRWIAGLEKGKFPEFLKAVEIHLLTNNAQRHETVRHDISYFNPYLILKRRYRLWKILYELNINHCFVNDDMFELFEIKKNLREFSKEYSELNNHMINYMMVVLTIAMTLFTIV